MSGLRGKPCQSPGFYFYKIFLWGSLAWLSAFCVGVGASEEGVDDFDSESFHHFVTEVILPDTRGYLEEIKGIEGRHLKEMVRVLIKDGHLDQDDDKAINKDWNWKSPLSYGKDVYQRFKCLLEVASSVEKQKLQDVMMLIENPASMKDLQLKKKDKDVLIELGKKIKADYHDWYTEQFSTPPNSPLPQPSGSPSPEPSAPALSDALPPPPFNPGYPFPAAIDTLPAPLYGITGQFEMRYGSVDEISGGKSENRLDYMKLHVNDLARKWLENAEAGNIDWQSVALTWLSVGGPPSMVSEMYHWSIQERLNYLLSVMLARDEAVSVNFLVKFSSLIYAKNYEREDSVQSQWTSAFKDAVASVGMTPTSFKDELEKSFPDWISRPEQIAIVSNFFKAHKKNFDDVQLHDAKSLESLLNLEHNPGMEPILGKVTFRMRMQCYSQSESNVFDLFLKEFGPKGVLQASEPEVQQALINTLQASGTPKQQLCIMIMSHGGILVNVTGEMTTPAKLSIRRKRSAMPLDDVADRAGNIFPQAKKIKLSLDEYDDLRTIATEIGADWKSVGRYLLDGSFADMEGKLKSIQQHTQNDGCDMIKNQAYEVLVLAQKELGADGFEPRLKKALKDAKLMRVHGMLSGQ